MIFEGRTLPDAIDWDTQLDQVFTKPYDIWYGDARPLDWVVRYAKAHPGEASAIESALKRQLAKNDPEIRGQILEQAPYFPFDLSAALTQVLVRETDALRNERDPYRDGQSLLGAVVRALDRRGVDSPQVSADAVRILSDISRTDDGFPESFLIALRTDLDGSLPKLVTQLEGMSRDALDGFARRLADLPTPQCARVFETIGRNAPTFLRKRIANAIRKHVEPPTPEELEAYRAVAPPGSPAPSTEDRWPQFARWLGV